MKHRFSKRKRFICFLIGMALCGFGVALSTRPELGTSPISSLPYVLTFTAPLSFGMWTVLVNLLFLLGQLCIQGRDFKLHQLSQILSVSLFGFFIDLGMWCSHFYIPQNYALRMLEQLAGCLILASGIACELAANVSYLPGEGLVKALAIWRNWNFGTVKICFDVTLVVLAVLVSVLTAGSINGIREGTLVAAIVVGFLVRLLHGPFRTVRKSLVKA